MSNPDRTITFGTDGWRALIARDYTFANVRACAEGVCRLLESHGEAHKGIVVGYDTRFGSPEFGLEVARVSTAHGIRTFLSDSFVPTPVVSYNLLHRQCGGGVVITASHNSGLWNGFKYKPNYAGSASPAIIGELEGLIAEASDVWLISGEGKTVAGHVVGYDYDTGFGLVQALSDMNLPVSNIAQSSATPSDKRLVLAGSGGVSQAIEVTVLERKEFAGYWEYVLEDAIYTAPAHPNWGGAALFDDLGNLSGIGSLFVDNFSSKAPNHQGNLCVPTEQLNPIVSEICKFGRKLGDPRPWLGFFVSLVEGRFLVVGAYENGPATRAGLKAGDSIEEVAGFTPRDLGHFFKSIWDIGPAGSEIPLTIRRGGNRFEISVESADRMSLWKSPRVH